MRAPSCARCSTASAGTRHAPKATAPARCARELIRTLGELGDEEVLAEARHRFAVFQQQPAIAAAEPARRRHAARRHRRRPRAPTTRCSRLPANRPAASASAIIRRPRARAIRRWRSETLNLTLTSELPIERDRQHAQRDGVGRRPRRPGLGVRAQELQDAGRPAGLVVPQLFRSEPDEKLQRPELCQRTGRLSRRCTRAPVPARPPRRRKATSGSTPT